MTPGDEDDLERGGDDLLAAEYVLGVLPADERQEAARRIGRDAAFARLVEAWEQRLSPLNGFYGEVEAPAAVKQRIDARLFAAGAGETAGPAPGPFASLAFWRGLAIAAVVGLVALAVWTAAPFLRPANVEPEARLVASLASEETDVRYLVVYDGGESEIALSHVTGDRAPQRDFELWVIEGDEAPVSLGVVPVGAAVRVAVADDIRRKIEAGAVLAVSVEPEGGSPTGQPTGPVVAAGDLRTI